jgi:hypothetical protein
MGNAGNLTGWGRVSHGKRWDSGMWVDRVGLKNVRVTAPYTDNRLSSAKCPVAWHEWGQSFLNAEDSHEQLR